MVKGLYKRWELNGRLLQRGDKVLVKYNPAENINKKELFIFNGEHLKKEGINLAVDSIYIDDMWLVP